MSNTAWNHPCTAKANLGNVIVNGGGMMQAMICGAREVITKEQDAVLVEPMDEIPMTQSEYGSGRSI